ncbi:MAG: STT3 domain-containing protein, partial [Halobacteriaceae archaeon]
MSEESDENSVNPPEFLQNYRDWYQYPVLGVLIAFMLWVRTRSFERFTVNGEILFTGNDPWYHYRMIVYTVNHWPRTMPYDPWTHFSVGTNVGQFGTLFDQLIATAALIVGLGNPTEHTIRLVTLFSPAVFGSLVAIPTYFVTKRLSGRVPALFAALVLALLPGQFLSRSLIGFADHNIAEPLFQTTAVVFILIALAIGERDRPVFEQFQERDVEGLRSVLGWSVLAGVSIALYMWVWPPGIMLVGILGVFFTVKLSWDYWRG